jgi:pre-rRNA-processing protein TSR4
MSLNSVSGRFLFFLFYFSFLLRVKMVKYVIHRYELGGTPLAFTGDKVFDWLFPRPEATTVPVSKAESKVTAGVKRTLDGSRIPACPVCKSRRVFECQLMPNLINVLRMETDGDHLQKLSDDERRKMIERELKSKSSEGLEWGTCMVFSCEKDCGGEGGDMWQEEHVLIQGDE